MVLAHHRRETLFKPAEEIAEPTIAVTVRVGVPVLLPQHHQIDAGPLQLARKPSPIRLDPPAQPRAHARWRKQALFENRIGHLGGQGPPQARRLGPLEVVLDG
jgi:hypothetical protein